MKEDKDLLTGFDAWQPLAPTRLMKMRKESATEGTYSVKSTLHVTVIMASYCNPMPALPLSMSRFISHFHQFSVPLPEAKPVRSLLGFGVMALFPSLPLLPFPCHGATT